MVAKQVIAAEAYRELSPAGKGRVDKILKSHPQYQRWEQSFKAESAGVDLPMYIFRVSSTWADEIRRSGNQ